MTAILIFAALILAACLSLWLVLRSRRAEPGASGMEPDRQQKGAPLQREPTDERGMRRPRTGESRPDSSPPRDRG